MKLRSFEGKYSPDLPSNPADEIVVIAVVVVVTVAAVVDEES